MTGKEARPVPFSDPGMRVALQLAFSNLGGQACSLPAGHQGLTGAATFRVIERVEVGCPQLLNAAPPLPMGLLPMEHMLSRESYALSGRAFFCKSQCCKLCVSPLGWLYLGGLRVGTL